MLLQKPGKLTNCERDPRQQNSNFNELFDISIPIIIILFHGFCEISNKTSRLEISAAETYGG